MDNTMDSIGEILKQERERRGLTVDATHEATKITVQSIVALEENRFESFPNKVYARAFLRDYANFLNIDSAALLTAYEEKWGASTEKAPAPVVKTGGGSGWRAVGLTLLVLLLVAGIAAGGFYAWKVFDSPGGVSRTSRSNESGVKRPEVATIPKAQPVTPPKPEAPKPEVAPKPVVPVVPQKAVLEVTALQGPNVWVRTKTDGNAFVDVYIKKGETKTYEGKQTVFVRVGRAGAVQLKFNGQVQALPGNPRNPSEKTFTLPATPAPASAGPPAAAPPATPVPSANPPAPASAPH